MQRLIQIQIGASADDITRAIATASAYGCSAIELACVSADLSVCVNSQSVQELLDHCARRGLAGCAGVWLPAFESGCSLTRAGDTGGLWDASSLTCPSQGSRVKDADANAHKNATRQLEAIIESTARLGAARLSIAPAVVCASDPDHVAYQDALNRTFDALQLLVRSAERCGVTLALCAAHNGFLMSPPELRDLVRRLNSHAIGADVDTKDRDDRASAADWLATLGNLTQVVGVSTGDNVLHTRRRLRRLWDAQRSSRVEDLDSLESTFRRYAPAAYQSAQLVLRPSPPALETKG